ncbi:MAG: GldG family protein, partial [Armatimonadota bacterium]|nr:GldG family protein [Armatimonadota bacterium]
MSSRIHHVELSRRDQVGIALGWASLFFLAVGLIWYIGNTTLVRWNMAVLGVGAALGIAYLVVRKEAALSVITSREAGGHANATVYILAVFAIVVCINYIASRRVWQYDLTRQRLYTLSPQTKEVLKNLKDEVKATAFYQLAGRGGAEGQKARDLLKQYQDACKKFKFEMVDPVAQPAKAAQLGVTSLNVVWLESGGRKETVYSLGEQELTSAIIKVTRPTKKKIYFLFGHGEKDIESYDSRNGMSDAKQVLEKLNYEVSKLILQTVKEVPADAAVVVVAGPRKGIPDNEQKILADYLKKGGKMLLLLDAPVQPGT